jgi:hypothetical protein
MIALSPLTLIGAPILAVLWWLSDRDYADPKGTGRRVRGIGWVLTALWVGHKIF